MDHAVSFPFLVLLSYPICPVAADQSQAIKACSQGLITCFTSDKPCVYFLISNYIQAACIYHIHKEGIPQISDLASLFSLIASPHLILYSCHASYPHIVVPPWTLVLPHPFHPTTFASHILLAIMLGDCPLPPFCTLRASLGSHFN